MSRERALSPLCCDLMLFDYRFQFMHGNAHRGGSCDLMLFDYRFQC